MFALQSDMYREGTLDVFCTGRDTHQSRDLYRIFGGVPAGTLKIAKRHFGPGATKRGPGDRIYDPKHFGIVGAVRTDGQRMNHNRKLECKACGRKVPVSPDAVGLLLAAGWLNKRIDLSYIEDTIRYVRHAANEPRS